MEDEKKDVSDIFIQGNPVNESGPNYSLLTEEDLEAMATVPSEEEQKRIQDALGPRRSTQIDTRTEEEKLEAERIFKYNQAREKRNQVPHGHRDQIKVKREVKRNIQKASRKSNRGN